MRSILFLALSIIILLSNGCSEGPEYKKEEGKITWLDITKADELANKDQKMYFIDMYTDWCGWCKVMDKKTFSDPDVIAYMNDHFHAIKFDAETKQNISFDDKKYKWIPRGRNGVNELAKDLLQNKLSYPSYVYLDANKKPIKISKGFMPSDQFMKDMQSISK